MSWTTWIGLGSVLAGLSVGFGAFGAHGLKGRVSAEDLVIFETAARYQMYHALALIGVGLIGTKVDGALIRLSGAFFLVGSIVFSGSLYVLVLAGQRWMGMITPFGGLLLILGWVVLAWSFLRL